MTLDELLANWREESAVLRRAGHAEEAERRLQMAEQVADAAAEYLQWIPEADAMARSGRGVEFFRTRFPEWERARNARKVGRKRFYRLVVVPQRANVSAVYEAAKQGAA